MFMVSYPVLGLGVMFKGLRVAFEGILLDRECYVSVLRLYYPFAESKILTVVMILYLQCPYLPGVRVGWLDFGKLWVRQSSSGEG